MSPLQVFDLKFSGHHIVEAAAGTGKTYSITSLYVRALVEKQLLPSQILVLTFTNDATDFAISDLISVANLSSFSKWIKLKGAIGPVVEEM